MILSRHLPRSVRKTLTSRPFDRDRHGGNEEHAPDTAPGYRHDPDWAVREIVDEVMFAPLR